MLALIAFPECLGLSGGIDRNQNYTKYVLNVHTIDLSPFVDVILWFRFPPAEEGTPNGDHLACPAPGLLRSHNILYLVVSDSAFVIITQDWVPTIENFTRSMICLILLCVYINVSWTSNITIRCLVFLDPSSLLQYFLLHWNPSVAFPCYPLMALTPTDRRVAVSRAIDANAIWYGGPIPDAQHEPLGGTWPSSTKDSVFFWRYSWS